MKQEFIQCETCGKEIKKPEGGSASVVCPVCGATNVVEDNLSTSTGAQKLKLSTNAAANPEFKMCPYCEAPIELDALRCTQCGKVVALDEGQGEDAGVPPKASAVPVAGTMLPVPVVLVGVVCVVLSITCVFLAIMLFRAGSGQPETSSVSVSNETEKVLASTEGVESSDAQIDEESVVAEVPLTPHQLVEKQVYEDLDRDYPLFVRGQKVALLRRGGIITRGTVEELAAESIVLLDDMQRPLQVDYKELSHKDRLRCDATYREQKAQDVLIKRLRTRGLE